MKNFTKHHHPIICKKEDANLFREIFGDYIDREEVGKCSILFVPKGIDENKRMFNVIDFDDMEIGTLEGFLHSEYAIVCKDNIEAMNVWNKIVIATRGQMGLYSIRIEDGKYLIFRKNNRDGDPVRIDDVIPLDLKHVKFIDIKPKVEIPTDMEIAIDYAINSFKSNSSPRSIEEYSTDELKDIVSRRESVDRIKEIEENIDYNRALIEKLDCDISTIYSRLLTDKTVVMEYRNKVVDHIDDLNKERMEIIQSLGKCR